MSGFDSSRGAVLAAAVAALFTAGCTAQKEAEERQATPASDQAMPGMSGMKDMAAETAPAGEGAVEVKVACFGINACKGQSDCATPNNACKGMNSCKGQGFKYVSLKECEAQGGKVITPSM